ncbi:MAG: site-2 protease family protein [Bacteroidota bacterium]
MKGTFKISTFFGIPVQVHWSFALIIVWVIFSGYSNGMDSKGTFWLGMLMLSLFVCVVMHEYGHALTARRFGVNTRDIILLPIGGVARLEKLPEKPMHEFWVAIAGPLVNIALAIILSIYFLIEPWESVLQAFRYEGGAVLARTFIPYLIVMNLGLAAFNLLPAFPMDGGRILRALLSIKMTKAKATQVASIVGQVFALAFVVASIYPLKSPMLTLLGVFVFFIARQENRNIQRESKLANTPITDLYRTDFTSLEPHDTIHTAHSVSQLKKEKNFVVVDEIGRVIGVLHSLFLQEAIEQEDFQAPIMLYMSQHYNCLSSQASLRDALVHFQREGYSIMPILTEGKLVGVIEQEDVKQYLTKLK